MQEVMIERACALLADGTVSRVLGWKNGEFAYDPTPAVFDSAEALQKAFVYNDFCVKVFDQAVSCRRKNFDFCKTL